MPCAYIGTSGWHYKHWKGTYYPADIKAADQFSVYQERLGTVEVNNTFYRLPEAETFGNWAAASKEDFIFSVKASRFFTHNKKLNVSKEEMHLFFDRVSHLGEKLGVILFQLPPKWKMNTERLRYFLSNLPEGYRYTFEFRDQSWYHEEVYSILKEFNIAFCIYELAGHRSPEVITADFVYIRLHGPGEKYSGDYSKQVLAAWARKCKKWMKEGRDVYVYFDNDIGGHAGFNAGELKNMLL